MTFNSNLAYYNTDNCRTLQSPQIIITNRILSRSAGDVYGELLNFHALIWWISSYWTEK